MPAYVKVSGAWKQATTAPACYIKVSGAWKKCSQVYVKVNGAWKPCYQTEKAVTYKCPSPLPQLAQYYAWQSEHRTNFINLNLKIGSRITISGEWRNTDTSTSYYNTFIIGMTGIKPESSYGTPRGTINWGDDKPERSCHYPSGGLPYDSAYNATYKSFTITLTVTKSPATFYLMPNLHFEVRKCIVQYTELI